MKISVTEIDLRIGVPLDCEACALHRAISRETTKKVLVGVGEVFIGGVSCRLPPVAELNRQRIDAGESVEAFDFDLEIPGEAAAGLTA